MRSQSAGNLFLEKGTSETLCNEIITSHENIKNISLHLPKHLKPLNKNQFGYYLAGLIDGDGHFSSQEQLVVVFDEKSISVAYFLKKEIGFGHVKKVKDKKAYLFIISKQEGIVKVLNLINHKIRSDNKLNQIQNLLQNKNYINLNIIFEKEKNNNLENHWLAGFSDADASFQIKIVERENKKEIRLNFQIDQKKDPLLLLIQNYLGGHIGYRKNQDTYYYGSTSFGSAKKVISYFDEYHLLSNKHLNYLKWRKAYLLILQKEHLTVKGIEKIEMLKNTMNNKAL